MRPVTVPQPLAVVEILMSCYVIACPLPVRHRARDIVQRPYPTLPRGTIPAQV